MAAFLTFMYKQDSDVREYKTWLGKQSKCPEDVTGIVGLFLTEYPMFMYYSNINMYNV